MRRLAVLSSSFTFLLTMPLCICCGIQKARPATPLGIAASLGDLEAVRGLLAHGSDPEEADPFGYTPLVWSAWEGRAEAAALLIRAGADPDRRCGRHGWTALMVAIHHGQTRTALALLGAGAAADARAPGGLSPLMMAAGEGDLALVRELLAHGSDPRRRTQLGVSALSSAVGFGHADVVGTLLEAFPDLSLGDGPGGMVALWVARFRRRDDILALVEEKR